MFAKNNFYATIISRKYKGENKMREIIAELATGSKELGFLMILILCIGAALLAWVLSENIVVILVVIFLTQHICRAIGCTCVSIERYKTARTRGSCWVG